MGQLNPLTAMWILVLRPPREWSGPDRLTPFFRRTCRMPVSSEDGQVDDEILDVPIIGQSLENAPPYAPWRSTGSRAVFSTR